MNSELYRKLVDLYAAGELPEELNQEMEAAALRDRDLAYEMQTLRSTVQRIKTEVGTPVFTEETHHRILMKLYASGAPVETASPSPAHLQYSLPIAG